MTETLTNGFYFDLVLIGVVLLIGAIVLWRKRRNNRKAWMAVDPLIRLLNSVNERDDELRRRQPLAEGEPAPVRVPIRTHEGDWDWPRRQEHNRLLGS